jgi:alpha-tubulin suppressor-like RCC1 family protein
MDSTAAAVYGKAMSAAAFSFIDLSGTQDEGFEAKSLAVGYSHTCYQTVYDELYCWGSNEHGQLGMHEGVQSLGRTFDVPNGQFPMSAVTKLPVPGGTIDRVVAGGDSTCVVLKNRRVLCFGRNGEGIVSDIFCEQVRILTMFFFQVNSDRETLTTTTH